MVNVAYTTLGTDITTYNTEVGDLWTAEQALLDKEQLLDAKRDESTRYSTTEDQLESVVNSFKAGVDQLEDLISAAEDEVTSLNTTRQGVIAERRAAYVAIAGLDTDISTKTGEVTTASGVHTSAVSAQETAADAHTAGRVALVDLQTELEDLEEQLATKTAERDVIIQQGGTPSTTLLNEIASLTDQVSDKNAEIADQKDTLAFLLADLRDKNAEVADADADLQVVVQELKDLQSQKEEKQALYEAKYDEFTDLTAKIKAITVITPETPAVPTNVLADDGAPDLAPTAASYLKSLNDLKTAWDADVASVETTNFAPFKTAGDASNDDATGTTGTLVSDVTTARSDVTTAKSDLRTARDALNVTLGTIRDLEVAAAVALLKDFVAKGSVVLGAAATAVELEAATITAIGEVCETAKVHDAQIDIEAALNDPILYEEVRRAIVADPVGFFFHLYPEGCFSDLSPEMQAEFVKSIHDAFLLEAETSLAALGAATGSNSQVSGGDVSQYLLAAVIFVLFFLILLGLFMYFSRR